MRVLRSTKAIVALVTTVVAVGALAAVGLSGVITQGGCTAKTVGAGDTFVEVPYLPVRGVATGRVAWTTTFLVRYEEAPTIPVPSRCQ